MIIRQKYYFTQSLKAYYSKWLPKFSYFDKISGLCPPTHKYLSGNKQKKSVS